MGYEDLTPLPADTPDGLDVYETKSGQRVYPQNIPLGNSIEIHFGKDNEYTSHTIENVNGILMIDGNPLDKNTVYSDPQGKKHKIVVSQPPTSFPEHPAARTFTVWGEEIQG